MNEPIQVQKLAVLTLLGITFGLLGRAPAPAGAQVSGCRWEQGPSDLPIGVYDAAGAVAEGERSLYVQGGIDRDGVVRDDLWRLDLGSLDVERVVTSGARATRWGHSLTWVAAGHQPRLYLIGGNTSQADDAPSEKRVYTFDTGERTWRIEPMSGMPSLQDHAAAYDPQSGRIVMQGGCSDNGRGGGCQPQTETFVVDVAAAEVRRGQRDGPALAGHSMVFDPEARRMIMFGGTWDGRRGTDEVYVLALGGGSPENAIWEPLAVSGVRPERRYNHAAVYDPARHAMIVFGGLKVDGEPLNDTWALDFSSPGVAVWRDLAQLNQKRSGMVMAFDPIAQLTVQVSGGRPLGSEASKDIFLLRCSNVPTATPEAPTLTPVIGPSPTPTAIRTIGPSPTAASTLLPPPPTQPGPSPTPTESLGTRVPPAVTVGPDPTQTPLPSVTRAPDTAAPEGASLWLPWLGQAAPFAPPTVAAATATAPPVATAHPGASPTPGAGPSPSPGTPLACTSVEREPNDRLLESLDWPPLCAGVWATGSLPAGDPGDYLRIRVERAGRVLLRLEDVPAGRDYDLLLYDFAGSLLGSSQLPGSMAEEIALDLEVDEYVLRIYPSTGRSELPYRLRWSITP